MQRTGYTTVGYIGRPAPRRYAVTDLDQNIEQRFASFDAAQRLLGKLRHAKLDMIVRGERSTVARVG